MPNTRFDTPDDAHCRCPICGSALSFRDDTRPCGVPCPDCGYSIWCCEISVGDAVVLSVVPDLTPELEHIDRLCEKLAESGDIQRVIVDLSALDATSTAMAARLVAMNKRIKSAGGKLILCGLNRLVLDTFHGCKLDRVFEICEDQESALASF